MSFLTHHQLRLTHHAVSARVIARADSTGIENKELKIIQLSDLHFYEHSDETYFNEVIALVNEQEADVIALTGDFIHYGSDYLSVAQQYLSQLKARHLKVAVLGNHDYNDHAGGAFVTALLQEMGYQVLVNTACYLDLHGGIYFAGVDDLWCGQPNIDTALQAVDADEKPLVMLSHNPLLFDPIAMQSKRNVNLVLSGHTHAGHVYLPFLKPVYDHFFQMKYRYGAFDKNNTRLYVTSGVGGAAYYYKKEGIKKGLPPFRFNTYPEVVLHTLSC